MDPSDDTLRYFKFDHLPEHLQKVARPFAELAAELVLRLPADGFQRRWCLGFLLLAKDAAVRAALDLSKDLS